MIIHRLKRGTLLVLLLLSILITACANSQVTQNKEVFVSAAVSLHDALTEIQKIYEIEHKNVLIRYNYGGSGALQKQIEQGAPADIFLSAGKAQMDALESKNLIKPSSRINLVRNNLVLVVPMNNQSINEPQDLAKKEVLRVAIGSPESVPAGKYAKEGLEYYQLWNRIQAKLVYTEDVSQVLRYVETGNVDAGIVYESDFKSSGKVKRVLQFPEGSYSPIEYPAALLLNGKDKKEAEEFLQYLQSSEALNVFKKHGFSSQD